jgi:hypothetical protein
MKDKYEAECAAIEQHCTYTAETHHIIATKQKRIANFLQIGPAVLAAVLITLAGVQVFEPWTTWLGAATAIISAVSSVLNPFANYQNHLNAAKGFTILKQDARALKSTFSAAMSDDAFGVEVKALHNRYTDLVRMSPETDKRSFEEARERIRKGIHELD